MSQDQMPTPEWDQLIAERGGRGPTEFEGHDTWDDSEEARQAYARGVAEAQATQAAFWGRADAAPAGSSAAAEPASVGTSSDRGSSAGASSDGVSSDRVSSAGASTDGVSSDRVSSAGKPAKQPVGKSSATATAEANGASGAAGTKAARSTRSKPAGKGAGAS
jgi:hypothetical protein